MSAPRQVCRNAVLLTLLALAAPVAAHAAGTPHHLAGAQPLMGQDTSTCEAPGQREDERARAARYRAIHDSALVLVRGAARSAGVESPAGLVSIALGEGVRTYGGNVPSEALADVGPPLLDLVLAHRSVDPRNRDAMLLLRLDPHPLPPCGDRGRRNRPPVLRNRGEISRLLSTVAGKLPPGPFRAELKLGIVLTRDAEVAAATIIDSRTATAVSGEVLDLVRRMRFKAGEIDGVTQDCVVYLPITMISREIPEPRMPPSTWQ